MTTQASAARIPDERLSLLSKIDRALEAVDRLVPLDDERYHKTHEAFEARSNQRERILAWLSEHSSKVATRTGDLRVLSIGCGDGSVDLPTARTLGDKADHVHFAALDPNKAQLRQLEKVFAGAALSNVTLTTHAMQLGDFDATERFDQIHCVHSFYYMPDPATALKQAIEMLTDDGELLLFHAPCEDLNSLSARFYNKYYERTTPFAEDFASMLDETGHSFRRERIDARIDVTSHFDSSSTHGHELRDFILQFESSNLPSAVVDPVERYMRVIAEGNSSAASIAHPLDVFVIRRRTTGTH